KSPSLNISLESNSSVDNENVTAIKKPKKKKKHNKNLNSIELSTNNDMEIISFENTCEKDKEKEIDSYFSKNISQKRKYEISAMADIENIPTKKPKKKKKPDKCLNTIYDTGDIIFEELSEQNINDFESEENLNQVIKSEINTSSDISLGKNCSVDNENVQTKTPKKKKKYNKSLNSLEFSSNNNIEEINTIKRTNLNSNENILISDNNYGKPMNENNMPVVSENFNTSSVLKISQNQCKFKTLLNSMETHDFEDQSTKIETKFNLMKYLKNKNPSLRDHPKFKQIKETLSKKLKKIINKNYEITGSDIVLLKTVGSIILEKIVEKIDSAQGLNGLIITLPPECKNNKIHFIETSLSRPPNKEKINIIKKLNPQVKIRVFNADEDDMIRKYWSKFQKEYNISNVLPFLAVDGFEMALNNIQRFQFFRYISAGLPNRLLNSVCNRFNNLYIKRRDKTCFSEEEDQLIMKVEECRAIQNKFCVLSLILNRSKLQLYRRHDVLKNQYKKCNKIIWDDEKRQELFTNILIETNTDNWRDLKNLTLKKKTLIKIAENLGKDVTYSKVRFQWNCLYTMLFCEKPIKMSTLRLNILELLLQQNHKYFADVNWIEITNQLYPGANSNIIFRLFRQWFIRIVPSQLKNNIKDTLFYLKVHYEDKLKKEIQENDEREFPRLTVQDYDLLVPKE
ncbi:uncharacterized protein LOC112600780, partial [Melanaphis sacchari]|uniref:uncharacterized protein LOC112600780 n=1 Tax=Melanaphis sacchari TaxID=742174 RepID=UPI000DC12CEE